MKKLWKALLCAAALTLTLTGCGSASPKGTVDSFLKAVKSQNQDKIKEYYDGELLTSDETEIDDSTEKGKAAEKALYDKMLAFDYKITDEKTDGDTASVTVEFKDYPIGDTMADALSDYIGSAFSAALGGSSQEEITNQFYDTLIEKYNGLKEKSYTRTATIKLTKKDGKWKIDDLDTDALNGIFGGLYTFGA